MTVRAYTPEDAALVATLVAADEELLYGHRSHLQAEDVVEWMAMAKEGWIFEDESGVLGAGWCGVWGETGSIVGIVAAKGRGIGAEIVRRGEDGLRGEAIAAVTRNEANRHGGGYVGAIGVRREWRGKGVAKALLYATFAEFWLRGVTRVTLGVDAESPTGATHLYERVGMHVESSTTVYEKPS